MEKCDNPPAGISCFRGTTRILISQMDVRSPRSRHIVEDRNSRSEETEKTAERHVHVDRNGKVYSDAQSTCCVRTVV